MADFEKKSFVLYHNFAHQFYMLSMEQRGRLITAIFEHEIHGAPTNPLKGKAAMAYSFIKDVLERDRAEYVTICERNAQNGKKGGRPKKERGEYEHKNTDKNPKKPKKADNENENDNENKNDNDNGNGNENDNEQCEAGNSAQQSCASASPREDAPLDSRCSASRSARDAPLTDREINNLIFEGLTPEYIDERQERAREYAAKSGRSAYDILVGWWKLDTRSAKPSGKGKKREDKALNDADEWFERRCQLIFDGKNNSQGDGS